MEKAQNSTVKKLETLLQEINQLESQITTVKDKLNILENEQKQEYYKRNLLEAKINNSNRNITFYQNHLKKYNTKLAEVTATHSKFSMAKEFYEKLLQMYREKYFSKETSKIPKENLLQETKLDFQTRMADLEKQSENLKLLIESNSTAIENLLKELQYVVE